jgi:hypothetical protein
MATGSKSTPPNLLSPTNKPYALRDSHAEVLARRAFRLALISELKGQTNRSTVPALLVKKTGAELHSLRDNVTLHLFVSESPCGDASIYECADDEKVNFTGAKLAAASDIREADQAVGTLRLKSGRSNLPATHRSTCHCCSDKILRWSTLGVSGSLLAKIVAPMYLSSVVVMRDPRGKSKAAQEAALARAVRGRVAVHVVDEAFASSRMTKVGASPSGVAVNYMCFDKGGGKGGADNVELTVGATGLMQQQGGKKRKKMDEGRSSSDQAAPKHSRLSRSNMTALVAGLLEGQQIGGGTAEVATATYQEWKRSMTSDEDREKREVFLGEEWVRDTELYDFPLNNS